MEQIEGQFGAILADPPWRFATWGSAGRDRCPETRHYQTLYLSEMSRWDLPAAPDCVLFLWTVDCHLQDALALGINWGFTYKTVAFTWIKRGVDGRTPIGMGYWTRGNPEQCLLFTRGKPRRLSASVRQLIEAPRREHSRKPDETYERIEQLVAGPYLELFSRSTRPGWTQWGDQAGMWEVGDAAR